MRSVLRTFLITTCGYILAAGCYNSGPYIWGAQIESGLIEDGTYYTSEHGEVSFRVPFDSDGGGYGSMAIHGRSFEQEFQIVVNSRQFPAEVYRIIIIETAEDLDYYDHNERHGVMVASMKQTLFEEYGTELEPISADTVMIADQEAIERAFTQHIPRRSAQAIPPLSAPSIDVGHLAFGLTGMDCEVLVWINWPIDSTDSVQSIDALKSQDPGVSARLDRFLGEFQIHC